MTVALPHSAHASISRLVTDQDHPPRPANLSAPQRDWDALYAALRPRLHRMALSMLHHEQDAEDVVQQTFLRGFARASELRDPAALEGWMLAVLRNAACDCLRRRRVRRAAPIDAGWVPEPVETRLLQPDSRLDLENAMAALQRPYRRILEAVAEGDSLGTIAVRQGLSYPAARTRLSRARSRLRQLLAV